MTSFQLITLPLLVVIAVATAVAIGRRRITPGLGLMWLAIWIGAAILIALPDISSLFARFLGIGRGADLVFYLSILFMFGGFFAVYLQFRRIDAQLTKIVRHLAIRDAHDPPEQQ